MKRSKLFFLIIGFVAVATFANAQTDASPKATKKEKQVKVQKEDAIKAIDLKHTEKNNGKQPVAKPEVVKMKKATYKAPPLSVQKKTDRSSLKKRLMEKKPAEKQQPKKE